MSRRATLNFGYLALFFAVSALSIFGEYFIDYLFYENVERAFASDYPCLKIKRHRHLVFKHHSLPARR